MTKARPGSVAVVGGGYAGLAAAVELCSHGVPTTLYEAAATLGGRARRVDRHGCVLDNGQHILVGAYTSTLALLDRVGVPAASLVRLPLQWRFPPRFELRAARAPSPWHLALGLLRARGLSLSARMRCALFLHACKRMQFRLARDCPVTELLARHRQDRDARRFLWDPLCIAALNTPPDEASAQTFLNVMRDSLAAERTASELLLPAVDLTNLFPEPAARYLASRGGTVRTGCPVQRIDANADSFSIHCRNETNHHDSVIVATAPQHVRALVGHLPPLAELLADIDALTYQPIVTVYLGYAKRPRLPAPMLGMSGEFGQWIFDRDILAGQTGLIAVVISARARNASMNHAELCRRVSDEVAVMLPGCGPPEWTQVIEEKRATFACLPDMRRPDQRTPLPGLHLAGDYTRSDYPATIEAAVRSGLACASLVRDGRCA